MKMTNVTGIGCKMSFLRDTTQLGGQQTVVRLDYPWLRQNLTAGVLNWIWAFEIHHPTLLYLTVGIQL